MFAPLLLLPLHSHCYSFFRHCCGDCHSLSLSLARVVCGSAVPVVLGGGGSYVPLLMAVPVPVVRACLAFGLLRMAADNIVATITQAALYHSSAA